MGPSGLLTLSNEIIRSIIDYIEADPEKLVNPDRRAYLSTESFNPVSPTPEDLSNLRLTCKRLSELGAIHQFGKVATRFSKHGFKRLEKIAGAPHIAKHVRRFSYLVPKFIEQGGSRFHRKRNCYIG